MVADVVSYGGEMDGEPAEVARLLPAAWVTFGGIQRTEMTDTTRRRYLAHGRFVVIVGDRHLGEATSRTGGALAEDVGTYRLVDAVRRLLAGQDLGLAIDHFQPGRVRTLFNTQVDSEALSVFACEFDTRWRETALDNGAFPLRDAPPDHPDALFTGYSGERSPPDPDWLRTRLRYDLTSTPATPDAEDKLSHDPDKR